MTCRELAEFLADYVSGDLPGEVSREFDGHLKRCPDCHLFVEQYRVTVHLCCEAYSDAPRRPLPEDLVHAILASLAKAAKTEA
jgi:hypothetical protein